MKKKNILPISTNVPVYTYTYYGYPHSIIAAEEYAGNYVAKVEISDYDQYNWSENLHNFSVQKTENCFKLYSNHPYRQSLHGLMFRELKEVDSVRVRIDHQQYAHPWGAVNIFIAEGEEESLLLGDDDYLCRLGYFNREGVYFRVKNIPQKLKYNMKCFPVELMLCRDHNYVEAYLWDDKDCYLLCQYELQEMESGSWKIGVQIRGNENVYVHWLYRNFIQISCDISSVNRPLDFFYGVEKDWHFHWVNYFLNTNEIPLQYVNAYGAMAFIHDCIDSGKYIELRLDQYFIVDREEYHTSHFLHQNLIYGYDDRKKQVYMLGYENAGKMKKTTISYKDLKYQLVKKKCVTEIYVIEYKPEAYALEYNPKYILKMIGQYLDKYNSSFDFGHLIEPRKRVFGMACYDELLSDKGMQLLLSDRRVLHLLYEHKALMRERLKYLGFYGAIPKKRLALCVENYSEVVNLAFNIQNLALKYEINGDEKIPMKIAEKLKRMRDVEKEVLSAII